MYITDTIDKEEIEVTLGYGGFLFVHHFVIGKKDAKKLAKFILDNQPHRKE